MCSLCKSKLKPSLVVEKTLNFENSEDYHKVVVRTEDSSVFVGGRDKKLSKYNTDFKFVDSLDFKNTLMCAITLNNLVVCGKWNKSLQIVNSSLETIKEIKLKNTP